MGVVAFSRREPEPDLVDRLLTLLDDSGPWQAYFVMKALLVHTPLSRSLAGEIIFSHVPYMDHFLPSVMGAARPVLVERLDAGEVPTFGRHLANLNVENAAKLDEMLAQWRNGPLSEMAATLLEEIDHWRATFVDRDVLNSVGRIWDSEPQVIEHPALARQVEDVLRPL